jgi:arylsulfatase A-like enzyme
VGDWAGEHDLPVTKPDAWHGRLPQAELTRARRAYYAQIAHIDNQIGRFLEALAAHDPGPTLIVFTSDHGEMLGDHNLFRKSYAYQGSARVPLIICPPGDRPRVPRRCAAPVVLQDLYPTILDAAGIAIPARTEGRSLQALCAGAPGIPGRTFVHGEHAASFKPETAMQFVTDGREKFVWLTTSGREQFFDLVADPDECCNLAAQPHHAARVDLWRRRLIDILAARPEDGLSGGRRLIPGTLPTIRPALRV